MAGTEFASSIEGADGPRSGAERQRQLMDRRHVSAPIGTKTCRNTSFPIKIAAASLPRLSCLDQGRGERPNFIIFSGICTVDEPALRPDREFGLTLLIPGFTNCRSAESEEQPAVNGRPDRAGRRSGSNPAEPHLRVRPDVMSEALAMRRSIRRTRARRPASPTATDRAATKRGTPPPTG
jgi:hypothetical protein